MTNQSLLLQLLERGDDVVNRVVQRPAVHLIQIEVIHLQTLQRLPDRLADPLR